MNDKILFYGQTLPYNRFCFTGSAVPEYEHLVRFSDNAADKLGNRAIIFQFFIFGYDPPIIQPVRDRVLAYKEIGAV